MKFTWGHAALIMPIIIAVVFTSVLIVSLSEEHQTELVTENYYAKELQFQEQIDQTKNALVLNTELNWTKEQGEYLLSLTGDFNPKEIQGTFLAFRPSDSKLDFSKEIALDSNGIQRFSVSNFSKGKYQIQVTWKVDGVECYLEKNIFVQ